MDGSIFSLIAFSLIFAGGIIGLSSFYYMKWKSKKEEQEIHNSLSRMYTIDYLESLKGTDKKTAIELGLKSHCYSVRIERLSYDTRHSLAFGFLESVIKDIEKMKSEEHITIEDIKEIFKKVTYMDMVWDADRSNNE